MRITLATAEGLVQIEPDGHASWVLKGDARVIAGRWAIADNALVAIDDPARALPVDPAPQCLAVSAGRVLVGTAMARLFFLNEPSRTLVPVASFDEIPSRAEWYTPWGGPPETRSLAIDEDGSVFVNVHVGGVWRGRGSGAWTEVVDRDSDTHQVLTTRGHVVIAAAVGFGQSKDGGRTFRWTTDGLHDTYCRAVARAGDHVLVTASGGPFSKQGAVYRRPIDGDGPFSKCERGLPDWFEGNIDTFQLAADGANVVLGTDDGEVFTSDDAGGSWRPVASHFEPIRGVALS